MTEDEQAAGRVRASLSMPRRTFAMAVAAFASGSARAAAQGADRKFVDLRPPTVDTSNLQEIEERMFPIFPWRPPQDHDIDGARWVEVLNGFQRFDPAVVVPGHGDMGGIRIALDLATHIETVGREVRRRRGDGQTAEQIIAEYKPAVVSAHPEWEHPDLVNWEIGYFAVQPG